MFDQTKTYKVFMLIAMVVAAIGAINWGTYAYGHNLVEKIVPSKAQKAFYVFVAICGVAVLFKAGRWAMKPMKASLIY
jgi:uncharacterized membrane protein YuzA (DUF378 family)